MYNFRTDLALERRDIYKQINKLNEIDGVESSEEKVDENIRISEVKILNSNGEKAIGKAIGVDDYCSHIFRFPNGFMSPANKSRKKEALKILEEMQNYILSILKSNPDNISFIDDIKQIETAKKEINLGMNPQNVFDNLCLKLIK